MGKKKHNKKTLTFFTIILLIVTILTGLTAIEEHEEYIKYGHEYDECREDLTSEVGWQSAFEICHNNWIDLKLKRNISRGIFWVLVALTLISWRIDNLKKTIRGENIIYENP